MILKNTTIKCHRCGKPYEFMLFYIGDQSACFDCIRKANVKEKRRRAGIGGQRNE